MPARADSWRGIGLRGLLGAAAVAAWAAGGGCASRGATAGRSPEAAPKAAPERAVGALVASEAVGVWALTDQRNSTFNVRLAADGVAISTWSGGPSGAIGERGRWVLTDGHVVIDWNTGWRDTLAVGLFGIEQWSWGPGDRLDAPPRSLGRAVPIRDDMAPFVGVWQMRGVLPGDPATIYVAIQSDGMVFKSIGDQRYGCWTVEGGVARITWANGWFDRLRKDREGYLVETWTPAANRDAAPSATNRVRPLE